jgi:LSD1 subclass zinc finger protein
MRQVTAELAQAQVEVAWQQGLARTQRQRADTLQGILDQIVERLRTYMVGRCSACRQPLTVYDHALTRRCSACQAVVDVALPRAADVDNDTLGMALLGVGGLLLLGLAANGSSG